MHYKNYKNNKFYQKRNDMSGIKQIYNPAFETQYILVTHKLSRRVI